MSFFQIHGRTSYTTLNDPYALVRFAMARLSTRIYAHIPLSIFMIAPLLAYRSPSTSAIPFWLDSPPSTSYTKDCGSIPVLLFASRSKYCLHHISTWNQTFHVLSCFSLLNFLALFQFSVSWLPVLLTG